MTWRWQITEWLEKAMPDGTVYCRMTIKNAIGLEVSNAVRVIPVQGQPLAREDARRLLREWAEEYDHDEEHGRDRDEDGDCAACAAADPIPFAPSVVDRLSGAPTEVV